MLELNKIYNEDCLDGMKKIDDKSIDMILCDLPYNLTEAKWDKLIPLDQLWINYKRILKKNGTVVLTASQPFTSYLIMSNVDWFKYVWVWDKRNATGHLNAKARPLKQHEDIIVFSDGSATSTSKTMTYNPQGLNDCNIVKSNFTTETTGERKSRKVGDKWIQNKTGYPKSILTFTYDKEKLHPTQKPVSLFEYLINTYTNENEVVLDNCIGSGTTPVASINTNRKYIGFELNEEYYNIAKERINNHIIENNLQDTYDIIA